MTHFLANQKVPYNDVQTEPSRATCTILCSKPPPSQRLWVVHELYNAMVAVATHAGKKEIPVSQLLPIAKCIVLRKYEREEVEEVAKLFERNVPSVTLGDSDSRKNEIMFSVLETVIIKECGGRYLGKASETYVSNDKSNALDALINRISCIEYAAIKLGLRELFKKKSPNQGNIIDLLLREGWKPISSLEKNCLVLFVKNKQVGHMGIGLNEKMLECKMSSINPFVAEYPLEAGRQICSPDHIIYLRSPEAQKNHGFVANKQVPYHELQLEPTACPDPVWCCQPDKTAFTPILEETLGAVIETVPKVVSKDFRGKFSLTKEWLLACIQEIVSNKKIPKKDLQETSKIVLNYVKDIEVDCDLTDQKNAKEWKKRTLKPLMIAIIVGHYGSKVICRASEKGIHDDVSCHQYATHEVGSNRIIENDPSYPMFPAHRFIDLFLKDGWVSTPVPEKGCLVLYIKEKKVVHSGVGLGDSSLECKFSSSTPFIVHYPIETGWHLYNPDAIVYLRKEVTKGNEKP